MSTNPPPLQPPAKPQAKALNCPHCGAAITLRALGQASAVVCQSCHSILDAKDPQLRVLQTFDEIVSQDPPLIPLGTRGKLRGTDYEVIGFERRSIKVDGVRYSWHEYVLFNPYKGFRYLSEYQGHWNDLVVCKELPIVDPRVSIPLQANYLGEIYKHFQTADANADFVLGEFPWQVRIGEQARVTDFVHPPRILSMEKSSGEISWSIGEYMTGHDVWSAFHLPGSPPEAVGVYENEPSPFNTKIAAVWQAFALFAILLLAMMIAFDVLAKKEPVFTSSYQFKSGKPQAEASFVTDTFQLTGRTSDVAVTSSAALQNAWIYLNYALINQDTGQAWDFGREVSFYSGYDSDGYWSEGSTSDTVVVPSVPPGTYYLRIEPESASFHPAIMYTVSVKRDVPVFSFYGYAFLALLIPAIIISWRSLSFERSRWSESDHPPAPILNTENN
jgi:uncharacterized protein DUF4178